MFVCFYFISVIDVAAFSPIACYSRSKPSSRKQLEHSSPARSPVLCSRCTKIVSPTPHDSSTSSDDSSKQNAADKEVKKYCIDMKVIITNQCIVFMLHSGVCFKVFALPYFFCTGHNLLILQ